MVALLMARVELISIYSEKIEARMRVQIGVTWSGGISLNLQTMDG